MADDKKKSKIDLKARLGKTSTLSGGTAAPVPLPVPGPSAPGSAPPPADSSPGVQRAPAAAPSQGGSVRPPIGIAPPPMGLSPGIPVPPWQTKKEAKAKPSAAQQTIKVEVGEEILKERADARKKTALYATLTAIVGIVIGGLVGQSCEKGGRLKDAAKGAAILEKDVRAANEKMKELDEKLKVAYDKMFPQGDAATKMSTRQFPEGLIADLGGINIPFDTGNLDNRPGENKQVGSLPGKTLKSLLSYTSAVEDANKTKDSLKNALTVAKDPTLKAWKEEKDPVANFAVVFSGPDSKTVAELAPIKEPFNWKGDFPGTLTVTRLEGGKAADKKASRWTKGGLTGGSDLMAIPIDPKTTAALINDQRISNAGKLLADLRKQLEGALNPDDPTNESLGLIKEGEALANQLHTASLNR